MTKVKGIMLTEKGVVKKVVRDNIASIESKKIASLGYEKVENKNVLVNEYVDTSGNMVYATISITVSTNDPRVEKPKKEKTSKNKDKESFEIVE